MTPEYKKRIEKCMDSYLSVYQKQGITSEEQITCLLTMVRTTFMKHGIDPALEVANKYIKRLVILGEIEWTSKIK